MSSMNPEVRTAVEPYTDGAACLEAWFRVLGAMDGFPVTDHPSGILPLEDRAEAFELAQERTRATLEAGIPVPVLDGMETLGLDVLDQLVVLALLRNSLDARQSEGLRLRQICEASGAADWKRQETLRSRLERAGALRHLGLVQSDGDTVAAERLYRLTPAWRAALLEGQAEASEAPASVPETVTGRLQEALFRSVELLEWVAPTPWTRSSGWADAFGDRPGWDHVGPRGRELVRVAASYLGPDGPAQGDPLGRLLESAGVATPAEVALLLLLLSRGPKDGPLSWAFLEAALKGMPGAEAGFHGLLGRDSALVRGGLVALRSEESEGALAAFAATPRARGLAVPMGVAAFEPAKDDAAKENEGPSGFEATSPRIGLKEIVLTREARERIEEALALPRALASGAADWGLDRSLLGQPGVVLLFHGEPGTGKTLCAEAIAGELGKALWRLRVDELLSRWVGETEQKVAAVFRRARAAGDVVLLDEADSVLSARNGQSARWETSMTNLLLQEIERFPGVLVMTTNRPDSLDPALERRVLAKVEFEMPGEEERLALWMRHIPAQVPIAPGVDLAEVARKYVLSGSGIRTAALFAVGRALARPEGERLLTNRDLETAAAAQLARKPKAAPVVGFAPMHEKRGGYAVAAGTRQEAPAVRPVDTVPRRERSR